MVQSTIRNNWLTIVLAALSGVLVVLLTYTPITCNDFWLQLKIGEFVAKTRTVPTIAYFPFTEARDYPLVAHEWLPSLWFYLLTKLFSYDGFVVLKGVLGCIIFGLSFLLCFQSGRRVPLALGMGIMVMIAINYRNFLRPEMFANIFLLLHLLFLLRYRQTGRRRWLFALLPLTVLWANSHGSYLLSLVFIPLAVAGDAFDRIKKSISEREGIAPGPFVRQQLPVIIVWVCIAGAIFINPYGYRLIQHSWSLSQGEWIRKYIYEWNPTFSEFIRTRLFFKVYIINMAIVVISMIAGRKRLRGFHVLVFLAFAYLSIQAQRHIAIFSLATCWIPAELIGDRFLSGRRRMIVSTAYGLLLAALIVRVAVAGNVSGVLPGNYYAAPMTLGAIQYINKNGLEGNVLNSYDLGSQIIYHHYPRLRIAIDSRIDIYGERYYVQFTRLFTNPRYLHDFLRRYSVKYIIIKTGDLDGFTAKSVLPQMNWGVLYQDRRTVIFGQL